MKKKIKKTTAKKVAPKKAKKITSPANHRKKKKITKSSVDKMIADFIKRIEAI